jgi:hypothetical protein
MVFITIWWHPSTQCTSKATSSLEIGGNPRASPGHPTVPRQPGLEPLIYHVHEFWHFIRHFTQSLPQTLQKSVNSKTSKNVPIV